MIPRIPYSSIQSGLSDDEIANIKRVGAVVVVGGVPKEVCVRYQPMKHH